LTRNGRREGKEKMAAEAIHGWAAQHKAQYQRPPPQSRRYEHVHRFSSDVHPKPTRFAHITRLPSAAAAHAAADQMTKPTLPTEPRSFPAADQMTKPTLPTEPRSFPAEPRSFHTEPRNWPSQQPPIQGRLRPAMARRSVFDAESRSGSEQGLTPDASPRDPSPKPQMSIAARRALTKELPPATGVLLPLNPYHLGMSKEAAEVRKREAPGGDLWNRRLTQTRVAAPGRAPGNGHKTGHSVWRDRRRR